jgi:peptidyl-tRNA hydrolase, PTH1 family
LKQLFTQIFLSIRKILRGSEEPRGIKCVIGLGNPGEQYSATRHNVGLRVVDSLAKLLTVDLQRGRGDFRFARCSDQADHFIIIAPLTFMNESGRAVEQAMKQFNLTSSDLMVVYDDFQLPLGTLRIRKEGTDGGHNGLASITSKLQTENIPRLRVGIAGKNCPTENKKELMATYVLSPFDHGEVRIAEEMIDHARAAALSWVHKGIEHAMNNYNKSYLQHGS